MSMAGSAPNPTPFGRYTLQRRIAVGGMAEVFLAELAIAAGVRKQVVIKRILKRLAVDESFVEMFIGEARIAAGLSHGNIAQLFDFGDVNGEYFLALEYVRGESLSRLFARAREKNLLPPVDYACFIAMEMCKGLHYAHTRLDEAHRPLNIVHRDISPQNVLVSHEGEVKIVDFGIAKAYGQEGNNNTAAGVVKGKYLYFSPEQARARPLDASTDVYATGVVLYEMLCGQLPYEGQMIDVLRCIVRGEFARPSTLNPAVTPELDAIVLKAMARTPAERYASAQEFQEALSNYLAINAQRFTQANLANLSRFLFRDELVAAGETASTPEEFRRQVNAWPPPPVMPATGTSPSTRAARPQSKGRGESGSTRAPTSPLALADPEAEVTVKGRPGRWAIALGILAVVGAAGATIGIARYFTPSDQLQPTQTVMAPTTAPSEVPKPQAVVEPPRPARTSPDSLADRLKSLPLAPGVAHGGRVVAGLKCQGGPTRPDVIDVAQQAEEASATSHHTAISMLERAIFAEPTAGILYTRLAVEADALSDLEPVAPLSLALETYAVTCPADATLSSVLQRAGGKSAPGIVSSGTLKAHRNPLPPSASSKELLDRFNEDLGDGDLTAAQLDLDRLRSLGSDVRKPQKRLNSVRDDAEARQAERDEVEFAGKSVAELVTIGSAAEDAKDCPKAIRLFHLAVKHSPKEPAAHQNLANCLVLVGRLDEGAAEYRRFVTLAPNDPKAPAIRSLLVNWDSLRKLH